MSMTMSTPSRTLLHLHLACRDLQRSPRGSVTRCTAAKTPYNGFNVIPLLSVDVNAIELVIYLIWQKNSHCLSPVNRIHSILWILLPFNSFFTYNLAIYKNYSQNQNFEEKSSISPKQTSTAIQHAFFTVSCLVQRTGGFKSLFWLIL